MAETRAKEAGDGPLLARVLEQRGNAVSEDAHLADVHCAAALELYVTALRVAGAAWEQAGIRASARFGMSWQLAARGEVRGALMELEAATFEAQTAGWVAAVIDSARGNPLRRMGYRAEAERAFSGALDTPPVRRIWVLRDLARLRIASGEIEAAAEALEEAFLETRRHRVPGRVPGILAVRALLPNGRAARGLDDVLYGS